MKSKAKDILHYLTKPFFSTGSASSTEGDLEQIAAQEQRQLSYDTLAKATDNFHHTRKLGEGGFGPVYKGKLDNGKEIAVKKLSRSSRQGKREFKNEAKLLARVQHRNVVNLLGYCTHGEDKLLVYEYIPRESLDKFLFKPERRGQLDWKIRFGIIAGVAKGLQYLHEDAHCTIIHRDVKPANILLDEKWVPKIADFGMARLFPEDQTHVNTRIAGTNGYMAPEYVMQGHLSTKADVYSFGVVILELVSGRRISALDMSFEGNLLDWAYKLYKKGRSLEIMDTLLTSTAIEEQVALCIQIGLLCTQCEPSLRPDMRRVSIMLSKKPSSLEEPTRPSFTGNRHRRPRQAGAGTYGSSSNAGTSGISSSHRSESTTATNTNNPTTMGTASTYMSKSPRSPIDHGKRPIIS